MAAHSNPVSTGPNPGRGGRARVSQSMEAREPLDPAWLESVRRSFGERDRIRVEHDGSARDYTLFFLTGHPRSGTHWLGALLNLHPLVYTDGEFFFDVLRESHDRLAAWKWLTVAGDAGHRSLNEACFQDSVRRLLVAVAPRKAGASYIGDRTPRELRALLPGASHIVLMRDGRDVLVSWTFHQLRVGGRQLADYCKGTGGASGMEPVRRAYQSDHAVFDREPELLLSDERWVRAMAAQWARHVTGDAEAMEAMRTGAVDARALLVRYEDLHRDTAGQLGRVFAFLGLDAAAAAPIASVHGASSGEGSDPRTFFRSGKVGDWRRYFPPSASRWFAEEAGRALVQFGYETTHDWPRSALSGKEIAGR